MNRYLISSEKFKGEIELIYKDVDGLMLFHKIDFTATNCTGSQIQKIKDGIPMCESTLATAFASLPVTIVPAEIEITFDMWWKKYNKKINKIRCIPLFKKLTKTDQVESYAGIDEYDKFLAVETWRKKADPENYLRKRMWENEWQ